MKTTAHSELWGGVRGEAPILLGVIPFGLIYGVSAVGAGISHILAQAMSAIIFAGSAQFVTAQLVGAKVPAAIIILTGAVINLRHMLYSASLAPYTRSLPFGWKWLLAYLLTDEAYAVTIIHYRADGATPRSHWYFLGAGLALWSTWQVSTLVGVVLGASVPARWSLDFTLALTFIALVVPVLRDRPSAAAAGVAGIVAIFAYGLPLKLGIIVATLAGLLVGVLLETRLQQPAPTVESELLPTG